MLPFNETFISAVCNSASGLQKVMSDTEVGDDSETDNKDRLQPGSLRYIECLKNIFKKLHAI